MPVEDINRILVGTPIPRGAGQVKDTGAGKSAGASKTDAGRSKEDVSRLENAEEGYQ